MTSFRMDTLSIFEYHPPEHHFCQVRFGSGNAVKPVCFTLFSQRVQSFDQKFPRALPMKPIQGSGLVAPDQVFYRHSWRSPRFSASSRDLDLAKP